MDLDSWLPIGYVLPDGAVTQLLARFGGDWQLFTTSGNGQALICKKELHQKWIANDLIEQGTFEKFRFGNDAFFSLSSGPSQIICPINGSRAPGTKTDALAFAIAMKASRELDQESAFQDSIYVEKISRLLPTYTITSKTDDDIVLGNWLTGGADISAKSFRRLNQSLSWLSPNSLKEIVEAAGFEVDEVVSSVKTKKRPTTKENSEVTQKESVAQQRSSHTDSESKNFELPGRPELAAFFNEHVIDIIKNRERYAALGVGFPSAMVLHGPPGCGKTFAVECLIDFLGWPSYQIDASSVASPYIHETSKKVADVFEKAIENSPSVLVIDEMEAFLADREMGSGHHRVEEVAEFLRRIPEAVSHDVLIFAMTNRIEMIDPAILRRGRFDHLIEVSFAKQEEIQELLEKLLSSLPKSGEIDTKLLASELQGRPLSDVTYVVREGARLAARSGKSAIDSESLNQALDGAPARAREGGGGEHRRIGFV